jgi:uncharacterized protein
MSSQLGKLLDTKVLEPDTTDSAIIKKGQTLRIIDLEGQQVADFVAWREGDMDEYQHVVYTNFANNSWKIGAGEKLYSNHMKTMWSITEDDCGNHYMGGAFCSHDLYTFLGDTPQRGCRDALEEEIKKHDTIPQHLREISCFNIFMNVIYDPDGTWGIRPPTTKAGDHIDLLAEMDMLWAVSICNDPWSNGEKPTAMQFELYDAA